MKNNVGKPYVRIDNNEPVKWLTRFTCPPKPHAGVGPRSMPSFGEMLASADKLARAPTAAAFARLRQHQPHHPKPYRNFIRSLPNDYHHYHHNDDTYSTGTPHSISRIWIPVAAYADTMGSGKGNSVATRVHRGNWTKHISSRRPDNQSRIQERRQECHD